MTAPAPLAVLESLFGLFDNRVLGVLVELGIPDLVTRPRTAAEIAEVVGADPDALERLLRYAASRRFVTVRSRGRFGSSPVSRLLEAGHPGEWDVWVRRANSAWFWDAWRELPEALGLPADRRPPQDVPSVDTAGTRLQAAALSRDLSWDRVTSVCDVGGGVGVVLERLLQDHEHLDGVLVDRPEVVAGSAPSLRSGPLAPRCQMVGGDYHTDLPRSCDRYVLMAIMTECSDEEAVMLLGAVRRVLDPDARVLVVDNVLSERPRDEMAQATDLLLLALGVGRERTLRQYRSVFEAAGLELVHAHHLSTGSVAFELTTSSR